MGSLHQYAEFRSEREADIPYFTPKQSVPTGAVVPEKDKDGNVNAVSPIFQPLTIRGVTFINRIFVSPMCMYSCENGMMTDFHLVHAGQFALRGAALVTLEATAVLPSVRFLLPIF